MSNNDILRRIRYVFDFKDQQMIEIFALADHQASQSDISSWLKPDEDESLKKIEDPIFAIFLNGLIVHKREKKDGPSPEPEKILNNNIIFTKLKIALNLKAEDVLQILDLANFRLGKHELSAFFRKKDHKHFRECKDQVLRNFLQGLQIKYRGDNNTSDKRNPDKSNPNKSNPEKSA